MELSETIELMQSEDYKERMKAEYWQTKIRHKKLSEMIKKYESGTLEFEPNCGLFLLMAQRDYMQGYLNLLEERAEREGIDLNGETAQGSNVAMRDSNREEIPVTTRKEVKIEQIQKCLREVVYLFVLWINHRPSLQQMKDDLVRLIDKYPEILIGEPLTM